MMGELERSGIGNPCDVDKVRSIAELQASCESSNKALLRNLRECSHASALLEQTRKDAALGRMTDPEPLANVDVSALLLNPRFGVEQEKEDGTFKVRAIDHLSWSPSTHGEQGGNARPSKKARKEYSVNGHVKASEKLHHDTLDALALAMRKYVEQLGCIPGLLKSDIDSAFRRVPVAPEHRWACGVAFVVDGDVMTSQHGACPFGAIGSVHAWEREGAAITHIARKFLKIALMRYVDDLFGPERWV